MNKKTNKILVLILLFGFALRIVGITYGLPLWLVGDEPPFVLSALKMIELKTLIPALHGNEFSTISYFPPYLSYLYLPPFIVILTIKFFSFAGSAAQFAQYLLLDLSVFFTVARFMSALIGTLTIWVLYRTAKNLFNNINIALLSAGFLSLSLMHILLSHWGRDWTYAVFLFVCAMYTMTQTNQSDRRRYVTTALIAGIAFGFSAAAIFIPIYMALHVLICERKNIFEILKNKSLWLSAVLFMGLAFFSYLLFPAGFFFSTTNSLGAPKTLGRLVEIYGSFIAPLLFNDPVLFFWACVGLAILAFKQSRIFWTFFLFINAYIVSFFAAFHAGDRFVVYLYPLFSLAAAYALHWLWYNTGGIRILKNAFYAASIVSFFAILIPAIRVDQILLRNDTRMQARQWIEQTLAPGTKIIVMASLTRLSATPGAIAEQEQIQPVSLRGVDRSERASQYIPYPTFHTLNLYSVSGAADVFYKTIDVRRTQDQYRFALISAESFGKDINKRDARNRLQQSGNQIKAFAGVDKYGYDLTEGTVGNFKNLFTMNANGPTMYIIEYK